MHEKGLDKFWDASSMRGVSTIIGALYGIGKKHAEWDTLQCNSCRLNIALSSSSVHLDWCRIPTCVPCRCKGGCGWLTPSLQVKTRTIARST
eukprot:scaffold179_cov373-Pavlova_lutheri.AAC.5